MRAKINGKSALSPAIQKQLRNGGISLDVGCGAHKQKPDWVGIDIQKLPGVDIIHDIETYPWPLPDNCCKIVVASHVAEHINPAKMGFIHWMNEVHRVLKVEHQFMMSLPYAGSPGYWQDPTHINPCNENTWAYFDPIHPSGFWGFYRPKPWKILQVTFNVEGFMEVALEKRRVDRTYAAETKKA